ncbi:MAG: MFS transporter [Acutalibacteraceae bacterium]
MMILLVVIYLVFISLGLPDSLFGVSWPVIHTDFGISQSFASVYSVITGVCTGTVSFVAGKMIRRFGTGKVTFVSVLLTAVGLLGMSLAPNIIVMMIFAVILGYGAGAIDTGLNNFVSLHYKAQHMNWLHCFWGIGVTASPIIMSVFLDGQHGSWRTGYRVVALLEVFFALIVLLSMNKWNKVEKIPVQNTGKVESKESKGFLALLKIKGVITGIISLGLYCSMEFLIGTWGATYIVNVFALAPDTASKWVSLYFGGIMLGRLISGFISMKASDNTMIRGGAAVALSGIIVLFLPVGSIKLLGLMLIGIGFGPIFPSVLHSVPSRFGSEYSADITGYHMGGAYAIGFGTQLAFGFIASATTFKILPFVLVSFCILLFIVNEITIAKTASNIRF